MVAQSEAADFTTAALSQLDDLDLLQESPETMILSTVSGDVSKDRTDRTLVAPSLKFLWEAYRTGLVSRVSYDIGHLEKQFSIRDTVPVCC